MDRLLDAARQNKKANTWAELARLLRVSDQVLTNWKERGIPRARIMDIAKVIDCDPYWIRDGHGIRPGALLSKEAIEVATEWQLLCEEKRVAYKTLIDSDAKHESSQEDQQIAPRGTGTHGQKK